MNILLVLLPVSLVLLGVAIWSFFWAVNKGQFDDLDTPALRILEDDPPPAASVFSAHGTDEDSAGRGHDDDDDGGSVAVTAAEADTDRAMRHGDVRR